MAEKNILGVLFPLVEKVSSKTVGTPSEFYGEDLPIINTQHTITFTATEDQLDSLAEVIAVGIKAIPIVEDDEEVVEEVVSDILPEFKVGGIYKATHKDFGYLPTFMVTKVEGRRLYGYRIYAEDGFTDEGWVRTSNYSDWQEVTEESERAAFSHKVAKLFLKEDQYYKVTAQPWSKNHVGEVVKFKELFSGGEFPAVMVESISAGKLWVDSFVMQSFTEATADEIAAFEEVANPKPKKIELQNITVEVGKIYANRSSTELFEVTGLKEEENYVTTASYDVEDEEYFTSEFGNASFFAEGIKEATAVEVALFKKAVAEHERAAA